MVISFHEFQNGKSKAMFPLTAMDRVNAVGKCPSGKNLASVAFKTNQDWKLGVMFVKDPQKYQISKLTLTYTVDEKNFPDVADSFIGSHEVSLPNIALFPSPIGRACAYPLKIEAQMGENEVLEIQSYYVRVFTSLSPILGKFPISNPSAFLYSSLKFVLFRSKRNL